MAGQILPGEAVCGRWQGGWGCLIVGGGYARATGVGLAKALRAAVKDAKMPTAPGLLPIALASAALPTVLAATPAQATISGDPRSTGGLAGEVASFQASLAAVLAPAASPALPMVAPLQGSAGQLAEIAVPARAVLPPQSSPTTLPVASPTARAAALRATPQPARQDPPDAALLMTPASPAPEVALAGGAAPAVVVPGDPTPGTENPAEAAMAGAPVVEATANTAPKAGPKPTAPGAGRGREAGAAGPARRPHNDEDAAAVPVSQPVSPEPQMPAAVERVDAPGTADAPSAAPRAMLASPEPVHTPSDRVAKLTGPPGDGHSGDPPQGVQDAALSQPSDVAVPAIGLPVPAPPESLARTAAAPTAAPASHGTGQATGQAGGQAAAALGTLARGGGSLTLRLDPVELGHVQIHIERPKDGPATVALTVERPETLLLLLRDQTQLHQALDQAGVPADGRAVSFHLAPAPAAASAQADGSGGGQMSQGLLGQNTQGQNPQGQNPQGQNSQGQQSQGQSWRVHAGAEFGAADDAGLAADHSIQRRWQRAGVDITA
jgi:flagellar hook-length control protein FliK